MNHPATIPQNHTATTNGVKPVVTLEALSEVLEAYRAWWPLAPATICRALVLRRFPLRETPIKTVIEKLDMITPEIESAVLRVAQAAIKSGAIPKTAIDARRASPDD